MWTQENKDPYLRSITYIYTHTHTYICDNYTLSNWLSSCQALIPGWTRVSARYLWTLKIIIPHTNPVLTKFPIDTIRLGFPSFSFNLKKNFFHVSFSSQITYFQLVLFSPKDKKVYSWFTNVLPKSIFVLIFEMYWLILLKSTLVTSHFSD